jgi:diguanylate cyclase (GGDEF)-like protein/PAS domain S-box-containing protein
MATILIVDDHVLNRQFLTVLLAYGGHHLLEAASDGEALILADAERPDLIIADVFMPNMNGHEFLARLRSVSGMAQTPVIFYTTANRQRDAESIAAETGIRWILPKPSDPAIILNTVSEALGLAANNADIITQPHPIDAQRDDTGFQSGHGPHSSWRSTSHDIPQEAGIENLQLVVQRFSHALTSLQAVSLRLTSLIDLGIELASERNPDNLLAISCRVVQDICEAQYAAIGIVDDDLAQITHYVMRGTDHAIQTRLRDTRPDAGVLGELLRRSVQRLGHVNGQPESIGLPSFHPPVHSFLGVPIANRHKVFGWLYLANKRSGMAFSEIDERAAATVASQLAVVYDNLVLYNEIQRQHILLKQEVDDRKRAQEALRRTLRARTVMAECNHVMVHATDEDALLQDMCRAVVDAGGYRLARIGYLSEDGNRLIPMAQAGAEEMDADGPTNISREHEVAVSLPLREGARIFGVLTIHEAIPNTFDSGQTAMLEELADDISYGVVSLRTKAAREEAERALRATEEKLSGILGSIDNVVWSVNESGFIYLNAVVEDIYGRPTEAFYNNKDLWFEAIHPDDRAAVRHAHATLAEKGSFTEEYRIMKPDGQIRWIEERARAVRNESGEVVRFDGIAIDISERKIYEARIEYLADHDALTSLANRNLLADRISQAMAHARRNGLLVALLFLDLDRFKSVNDSFGHSLGDALLIEIAERLKQVVRQGDTVARQGGDEFILLLTDIVKPQDVTVVARKIFQTFSAPIIIRGHELFVTVSIGATLYPTDGEDIQTLLRNADIAMYRAKEENGNAFQFYSRDMSIRALERAELESALRRALERKEFELFYQPKVDAATSRIIGAEALIRWNHPDMGLVSPTRFIPMAEEIGLIVPIGDWVLHTACAQNKAWQDAGLPKISVSINLSARQFNEEGLVESVAHALHSMDLQACHLELELTESMVMNSADHFITKLKDLENLGVQLSIDDFGTGYSSLSYLKRFPLHHLKIDQSFVRDIATDADDAAITSTVISLGHSLNLKVIAEGVETEEQVAFLRDHHCDEMQGYYFSKPLPASEFAHLLRRLH